MIRMEAFHLSISSLDTNETVELIDGVSSFFESRVKKETISETEDEEKLIGIDFRKLECMPSKVVRIAINLYNSPFS